MTIDNYDLSETLDTKSAATLLRHSAQTLRRWRMEGKGPKFLKVGNGKSSVFYRKEDLKAWMDKHVKLLSSNAEGKTA